MTQQGKVSLETLQRLGKAVGFDAIGATTADPFPELIPRLQAYEDRGLTGFESADIDSRVNPSGWMPGVRSLISVAMAYLTEAGYQMAHQHGSAARMEGRVTVYSYGDDYHRVMMARLNQLHRLLETEIGGPVRAKPLVDTGPWVDRRIAERAGIGWVGKNCLLYTDQHGSYVFLGALAVDIEMEPASAEQSSRCGSCTQCLTACPTGALIAPGVIDAPRCLSYITQMKGMIPEPFRAAMGKRVWGCDTCQWACPENRDVRYAEHPEYLPTRELAFPELVEVLGWSNREFQRRYGHTAAAWRGVRTWQRNALIALGNCRDKAAIPHILPFLQHARPELRASAAWALRRISPEDTRAATLQAFETEQDTSVQAEMSWARVSEPNMLPMGDETIEGNHSDSDQQAEGD